MLTRERVRLLLAMIAVVGLLTLLFVTLPMSGSDASVAPPIVKALKRQADRRKDPLNAAEIAELRRQAQSDQEKDKRTIKTHEFKDMPVKFHAIRNVDSDIWYKDLQIEVKNIGTKPIYFMLAYLEFPDHKNPQGRDTGFDLTFGDLKNWGIDVLADPQDLHLDPGQTYVFTIPAKFSRGLGKQHEKVPQEFKKLDFHIDMISFGDRTGFEIGRPLDLRSAKPAEGARDKRHHANKNAYAHLRSPPQDGCGSCARYTTQGLNVCFDLYIDEWCPPIPQVTTNPSRRCRSYRTVYVDCDNDGFEECPEDVVFDSEMCPGYSPTPTPTPTPEPTCDPTTKPNNTNCYCSSGVIAGQGPQWYCSCTYTDTDGRPWFGQPANYPVFGGAPGAGGCPSNKFNINGTDCCVCMLQNCPDGRPVDRNTCACPTPIQTPQLTTGGGDGHEPGDAFVICFFWVWYISYDNGQTWNETGQVDFGWCS